MAEEQAPPGGISKRRMLIHDLRQCLYSIHLAARVLERNREDAKRFAELCGMINQEQKSAAELLEQLAALGEQNEAPQT